MLKQVQIPQLTEDPKGMDRIEAKHPFHAPAAPAAATLSRLSAFTWKHEEVKTLNNYCEYSRKKNLTICLEA